MLAQKARFPLDQLCIGEYSLDVRIVLWQPRFDEAAYLLLAVAEHLGNLAERCATIHVIDRCQNRNTVAPPGVYKVVECRVALVPAEIEVRIGRTCTLLVEKSLEV